MTLSGRNRIFKTGIIVSLLILVLVAFAALTVLPAYPDLAAQAARRSSVLPNLWSAAPAAYVPYATMAASVVYAFVTLVLIFYFFEKTQTPEILFIALFVLSFAFESARLAVPLSLVRDLPPVFRIMACRVLLFGRYFGIFSLFVASVCAAGLEMQRQGNILMILTLASLVIALGRPIDGLSWDSSLCMLGGYSVMFNLVELAVMLITMVSFCVSVRSRGAKEYQFIALGSLLVFIGRGLLLKADTWIAPLPGLAILALGTWFICGRLHRVYLWL
ncbi:hypothetical protein AGMMS50267_05550 [Spirochaetia bacterium]|nr:hypothetical protein AGMMS50267_05550 [Spirochaetia bacterium]